MDILTIIDSFTWSRMLSMGFLSLIALFMYTLWKRSLDPNNKFHYIDMLSNPDGTASLTRTMQFAAGVTATWIVIKMAIAANLKIEFFITYLAAMGISEAFTKFVQAYFGRKTGGTSE